MKIRSLSAKLALLVGMLGLIQALAVLAFSYNVMLQSLDEQKRHLLQDTLRETERVIDQQANSGAIRDAAYQLAEIMSRHEGMHVAVKKYDKNETLIAFSPIGKESLHQLATATWAEDASLTWRSAETHSKMLSLSATGSTKNGDRYILILTADQSADEKILQRFLFTALAAAPFVLTLVCLGALAIVHIGLRPINRFRDAAIAVTTKNISARINPAHLPSELLSLCDAFNAMLDRLDEGIQRLSQFSGDLAHEMRTPLGILLGRTQVALSQPRTHAALLGVLEENVEELERMNRLVSDMLFLAQADSHSIVLVATPVDLATLAREVAEYMELPAEERGMAFSISGHATVAGDPALIQRAISNLVSNAIRYGAAKSVIEMEVEAGLSSVRFTVVNRGSPIPVEHHARLFDRFYRTEFSRARDSGGTGLGLSIVKAIMTLHEGSVEVNSHENGETRFCLVFRLLSGKR